VPLDRCAEPAVTELERGDSLGHELLDLAEVDELRRWFDCP
jgi:hypothetical protein